MIGLIDCNNFFVSCERVFRPDLQGKPVIVLSNNDGCVIARSQEAKNIGIKMGDPYFKLLPIIKNHGITIFSSNYSLYGDMSKRVMNTLQEFISCIEVYSIDEAFLNLNMIPDDQLKEFALYLVKYVQRGTGIPVSFGIAHTKTLAKIASKFAKKYPAYKGVCIIDTSCKQEKALKLFNIEDVWGIGYRYSEFLKHNGIKTAYDFIQRRESWIRHYLNVNGVRTWKELQGIACIDFENPASKKSICTSRSFAEMLTDYPDLRVAVSNFAATCSRKLREEKTAASVLTVFLLTNNFRIDLPQYYNSYTIQLPVPTSITSELITAARIVLEHIYMKGYKYKKAGVIVSGIIPSTEIQLNLFEKTDLPRYNRLYKVIDCVNKKYGMNTLRLAAQGSGKKWNLKNEFISRHYTTNLDDIIEIR